MKPNRTRPFILVASLAAAAMVFAADTTPKKAPADKAEPAAAPEAKPAPAAEATPAADAKPAAAKPAPGPDKVLATVDGVEIKASEIDADIARILKENNKQPQDIADQRDMIVRNMVDGKIMETLLNKVTAGTKITDADVEAEVEKIRAQGGGTKEEMMEALAKKGITMDKLKEQIRDFLPKQRWMEEQMKTKFVPPSDAEVKEFYDKNPQYFVQPEQVRASHILFLAKASATDAEVAGAKKKADAAAARAGKEDFATLAKELTEEPGGKERAGDLDFFPREGMMVEPFAAAAFKLKKGEVTPAPVRTEFGFHIIKVTDRKDEGKTPLTEVKPKILEHLSGMKKQSTEMEIVKELRDKSKVQVNLPPLEPPTPRQRPGAAAGEAERPGATKGGAKAAPARKPIEAVTPPVSADPIPEPAPAPAKDKEKK